ncbi:MAG: alkaline phosphatase family protein, partial [Candidatus Eisenbacteria bacterium]
MPAFPRSLASTTRVTALSLTIFGVAGHSQASVVPAHEHVVVVIMENKSADQVRTQPYTAALQKRGATFTRSFAVTHPSQPNYLALWAADLLGVYDNTCPAPGVPLMAENLGHACERAGIRWRAYTEDLPMAGSDTCSSEGNASAGLYTRKHEPWTDFGNLDHANERPYRDLAADIAAGRLPRLAFVIPNNCHNSHDATVAGCSAADADAWLSKALPPLLDAVGPRGLVILTWDEDDGSAGNHVLTVLAGGLVTPGAQSSRPITHYTVVRTICDALGIAPFGRAVAETPIDSVWVRPVSPSDHTGSVSGTRER